MTSLFDIALAPSPVMKTPALLALQRFIRSTFKQIVMGLIAFAMILSLSLHTAELPPDLDLAPQKGVVALSEDGNLLLAVMTSHHLTRARLAIPAPPLSGTSGVAAAQPSHI